ncbi:calcium/sodium antiporter [Acidiluteibacter ferrifornacis]|uniref:Calcium/sodium antiporter n=1 Tax=Acidiluteibacter ferrifornacis TaxID=2692424 RepID=A0A6N9NIS2_9FLAO|nr:calcium/sodium antiporter [Acidiluteibacter ferrifornacis]NBG66586.1 calcium/sodium antiporter [Acidiluteibacter ferrifornacis]
MLLSTLFLVGGFLLLILSGDFLVKGAVSLALKFKLSSLVIGMTIVSFGTSAPELLVSVDAALSGFPDITVGAIVGSNISNIALILGLTAIIFPIAVQRATIRTDWPMMMFSTLLFVSFVIDGVLSAIEGVVLFSSLVVFITWLIYNSRKNHQLPAMAEELDESVKSMPIWKAVFFIGLGALGLVFGADLMLEGAVDIARKFEVTERVIGLTIVAFGTSLPELITSCVAAYRKEADISIGNLIGSNIFNLLAILGITAMIHPIDVSQSIINFDNYVLVGISALIFPLIYFGKQVSRMKGVFLVVFYVIYIYSLF